MNIGFPVFALLVVAAIVIGSIQWRISKSRSVLKQWGDKNGLAIQQCEYRTFFRGPFSLTTSRGQAVYYVKVRDNEGIEHSGWIRCGGWIIGLMADKVEIRWEDKSK